jgi:preprotein translocase subunit SecA
MITKRIAAAQKAVEAQNFESRKHLLEYDDVMNKQRQAVYTHAPRSSGRRRSERPRLEMTRGRHRRHTIDDRCIEGSHIPPSDLAGLQTDVLTQFGVKRQHRRSHRADQPSRSKTSSPKR